MQFDFEKENNKPLIKRILISLLVWSIQIAAVVGLAYLFVEYTIERTTMIGSSMERTLEHEDNIVINKLFYNFSEPKRFDVIVFKQEDIEHSFYNIKRIIGLPGERIQILDGEIYVDEVKLEEPITVEIMKNSGLAAEGILLLENEYFVLGDNRNSSEDSRFANLGNILRDDIVGKAWIRTDEFDFIEKLNLKKEVE